MVTEGQLGITTINETPASQYESPFAFILHRHFAFDL
jgi:hypothetical protein